MKSHKSQPISIRKTLIYIRTMNLLPRNKGHSFPPPPHLRSVGQFKWINAWNLIQPFRFINFLHHEKDNRRYVDHQWPTHSIHSVDYFHCLHRINFKKLIWSAGGRRKCVLVFIDVCQACVRVCQLSFSIITQLKELPMRCVSGCTSDIKWINYARTIAEEEWEEN